MTDDEDVADVVIGSAGGTAGAAHQDKANDSESKDEEASHEALRKLADLPPVPEERAPYEMLVALATGNTRFARLHRTVGVY
ncbi:MAG: hypothetical protein L6Q95_02700 [Planctomycetes bacterium]|nr:hypothetical protein [Planctomycetota bacterium]